MNLSLLSNSIHNWTIDGLTFQEYLVLDVSSFSGLITSFFVNDISLTIQNLNEKTQIFDVGSILLNENTYIVFFNTKIKTSSFISYSSNQPNFQNDFANPESTALTFRINHEVTKIILTNETINLFYSNSKEVIFPSKFLSVVIVAIDTLSPMTLTISATSLNIKTLPAIVPCVNKGISVSFDDSCYYLNAESRGFVFKPRIGILTLSSRYSTPPDAFLLPLEADDVKYEFSPPVTVTPSPETLQTVSMSNVYTVYACVVFVLLIIVFGVIYISISCFQNTPELPQDMLLNSPSNFLDSMDSTLGNSSPWTDDTQ